MLIIFDFEKKKNGKKTSSFMIQACFGHFKPKLLTVDHFVLSNSLPPENGSHKCHYVPADDCVRTRSGW